MSLEPLKFKVAPHIVQDLGFNLYTNLPRVLVEFVANAYDADSPYAKVRLDNHEIEKARKVIKAEWECEKKKAPKTGKKVDRLAERVLPDQCQIVIEDAGIGMSRQDLQDKFLVAGRRRRKDDQKGRTEAGRILMGRKGLGKLAGFGIAQLITIISRARDETTLTKIVLDYNELITVTDTNEIPISETTLEELEGFPEHGTWIVLSRLLYEAMGSRLSTIEHRVGDHFAQIDPKDFRIELNGTIVKATPRKHVYGWPNPELPVDQVVKGSFSTEDGSTYEFHYRLRFVEDRAALEARERGVRVYAHRRLATAPELLGADTNMHGFRMTDYLDGVVYADFIDDQPEDYIATDRQSLRWESPLLAPMYELLSREIKNACYHRQIARDKEKQEEVKEDDFTRKEIEKAELSRREQKAAYRIAAAISSLHKKGYEDEGYRAQFTEVMGGLGRGEILTTLAELAKQENPDLDRVVAQVTRLTAAELDGFYKYVKGRINGIEALRKIVVSVDFKKTKNEDQLHELLNNCPWLIDVTFFEFLTSNQSEKTVFRQLEKVLEIGRETPPDYDASVPDEADPGGRNLRPDLVFLLGNGTLNRLVVTELKAPNTPLYGDHYRQLQKYVRDAKKWLRQRDMRNVTVEGILIGSFGPIDSKANEVEWLQEEIEKTRNQGECRVFGIDVLLERAEQVHKGLLEDRFSDEAALPTEAS